MGLDIYLRVDLNEQLRKDLPQVVNSLNSKRGLIGRVKGERYELREGEGSFSICVSDRGIRARNEGTPIVADIKVREGGLDGIIDVDKGGSIVRDYIHSLSHQYNIPIGYLLRTF